MKSPEYVSVVVSTYRKALDVIAGGKDTKTPGALRDLCQAFNRGFTAGYLFEKDPVDLMGRDAPDNRGVCIGFVNHYDKGSKSVTVKLTGSGVPAPGDGLLSLILKIPSGSTVFLSIRFPFRQKMKSSLTFLTRLNLVQEYLSHFQKILICVHGRSLLIPLSEYGIRFPWILILRLIPKAILYLKAGSVQGMEQQSRLFIALIFSWNLPVHIR
jgi:hypothetical protein